MLEIDLLKGERTYHISKRRYVTFYLQPISHPKNGMAKTHTMTMTRFT